MMDIEVVTKNAISENDAPFLSDEQKIIVGKEDKTISVLENGRLFNILPQVDFTKIDNTNGYIKLPINTDTPVIVQWGRVEVTPTSTQTFNFHVPFQDSCFLINATLSLISNDDTTIKADKESNTQFRIRAIGGTATARVYWFAVGV